MFFMPKNDKKCPILCKSALKNAKYSKTYYTKRLKKVGAGAVFLLFLCSKKNWAIIPENCDARNPVK